MNATITHPVYLLVNTNNGRAHAETERGPLCRRNVGTVQRFAVMSEAGMLTHLTERTPNPCSDCVSKLSYLVTAYPDNAATVNA